MRTLRSLPQHASRRRGRPGVRGFTLLELVVVAAVSSVLFLILIRWVLTLGAASSLTLDNAATDRAADVAREAFAADVRRATRCALGETSPLRSIAPDRVEFTVPSASVPGTTDLVIWQVRRAGTRYTLVRSVAPNANVADRCTFAPAAASMTYVEDTAAVEVDRILYGDPDVPAAFRPVTDGHVVTDPGQAWGECTDGVTAARCHADGLGIHWVLNSAARGSVPVIVDRTYLFAATGEALS